MARDEFVKVRINAHIKGEFQKLADEYGMTMSALGSYVIGSFVKQQRKLLDPLIADLGEQIVETVKEHIAKSAGRE
jgi:antitoxin component of RelBE/YafQ-DinJ toxin-antitoxin module